MILGRGEIEPHGYKLPEHSLIKLTVIYVAGEHAGSITQEVILPQEVVVLGYAVEAIGQSEPKP